MTHALNKGQRWLVTYLQAGQGRAGYDRTGQGMAGQDRENLLLVLTALGILARRFKHLAYPGGPKLTPFLYFLCIDQCLGPSLLQSIRVFLHPKSTAEFPATAELLEHYKSPEGLNCFQSLTSRKRIEH